MEEVKQTGKVKFFNEQKGYGFIIAPDESEIFVHATDLQDKVGMDTQVEYDVKQTPKGAKAVNVTIIK